jgi:protein-S-isoprenylcysteine O-methyltransferase Ste14
MPSPLPLAILALLHGANAQTANFQPIVKAHGIIGCIAWVIFFPLGAVAIRLLSTPKAWLVHATIQVFGYMLVIVNAGLGIWMGMDTHQVRPSSSSSFSLGSIAH